MSKSTNTKAMLVTSNGSQDLSDNYMREYMMARYGHKAKETDEVRCMPPIGKKIFWYVCSEVLLPLVLIRSDFPQHFPFAKNHLGLGSGPSYSRAPLNIRQTLPDTPKATHLFHILYPLLLLVGP